MARAGPVAGTWICPWCERTMPESEFSLDAYRKRMGKGPGRCRDCDREYARAKTALSPTGKYGDAPHSEAVHLAKETCQSHSWGKGWYTESVKSQARAQVAQKRIRGTSEGIGGLTAGERQAAEAVMVIGAARRQMEETRELDRRALNRDRPSKQVEVEVETEGVDGGYKVALREWRRRKEGPPPRKADYV